MLIIHDHSNSLLSLCLYSPIMGDCSVPSILLIFILKGPKPVTNPKTFILQGHLNPNPLSQKALPKDLEQLGPIQTTNATNAALAPHWRILQPLPPQGPHRGSLAPRSKTLLRCGRRGFVKSNRSTYFVKTNIVKNTIRDYDAKPTLINNYRNSCLKNQLKWKLTINQHINQHKPILFGSWPHGPFDFFNFFAAELRPALGVWVLPSWDGTWALRMSFNRAFFCKEDSKQSSVIFFAFGDYTGVNTNLYLFGMSKL